MVRRGHWSRSKVDVVKYSVVGQDYVWRCCTIMSEKSRKVRADVSAFIRAYQCLYVSSNSAAVSMSKNSVACVEVTQYVDCACHEHIEICKSTLDVSTCVMQRILFNVHIIKLKGIISCTRGEPQAKLMNDYALLLFQISTKDLCIKQ